VSDGVVMLISDLHANYGVVNAQVAHAAGEGGHAVEQVFVLGDFGFFADEMHAWFRRGKNTFPVPVACIEGNHEDHGALPALAARYADVVSYRPRGSVHDLGPWRGLCLGGARYMDACSTPRGCEVTAADLAACLAHEPDAVDLVLSHDCPADLGVANTPGLEHYGPTGVPLMDGLAARFRPRWWFFGHHHRWFELERDGTRYVGLPQSWRGYVLLSDDGGIACVEHDVTLEPRPAWPPWRRWFGRK
jgi:hypothetical protein